MKLITFAIPSYNSEDYMEKCIKSLLPGGKDVEILIVDDGSTDRTAEIADEYEAKYPGIVRAIHQENGGHGEAVNAGLRNATGLYYKVVDSDDWVNREAYHKVLKTLKKLVKDGEEIDMFLTNYVYEKVYEHSRRRMGYKLLFPQDQVIEWSDMMRNMEGFTILMHSVIYRTQMLRDCGLELPKHTFYVDNLFVYVPLPHVKKFYYLNVDFYRYFIGREGQSVAEETMIRRIDQQLRVNYLMIDQVDPMQVEEKHLRKYMLSYLEMITVVSTIMAYVSKDPVNLEKADKLWAYLKEKNPKAYRAVRWSFLGNGVRLPGKVGRQISIFVYRIAQKVMKFN